MNILLGLHELFMRKAEVENERAARYCGERLKVNRGDSNKFETVNPPPHTMFS